MNEDFDWIYISSTLSDILLPAYLLRLGRLACLGIVSGLLVKYLFVRALSRSSVSKSIVIDLTINLASALSGSLLSLVRFGLLHDSIEAVGHGHGFESAVYLFRVFGIFMYVTPFFAIFGYGIIEAMVIKKVFGSAEGLGRLFLFLCLANLICGGLAWTSLFLFDPLQRY